MKKRRKRKGERKDGKGRKERRKEEGVEGECERRIHMEKQKRESKRTETTVHWVRQ